MSRHVDHRLDEADVYQRAVAATFSERSKRLPGSEQQADAAPGIEQSHLLEACRAVIQRLSSDVDPRAGRLLLRPPCKSDVDGALAHHPALASAPLLSLPQFESLARAVLKRVAADRGRRLLCFVTAGVLVVQIVKDTIRKVPLLGVPVAALVGIVLPTSVVGPTLGVATALYVEAPRQAGH